MIRIHNELGTFYRDVDREVKRLTALHGDRLKCGPGCSGCCADEVTVYSIEADNIRRRHADLLRSGFAAEKGQCGFLDEKGGCRIYADRPYVCRTQGLPLRWLEETESGLVDMRDICPEHDSRFHVKIMEEKECWTIGAWEARLAQLQQNYANGNMERVTLRSMFR